MTDTNNTDGAALLPVTPELLPCPTPWCARGQDPYIFQRGPAFGACCPSCNLATNYHDDEGAAVNEWNTRISHSLPGDDAAQVKAVMSILWKREQYNGVGPDYDNYRPGSKFDMGGRVERYEKEARDIIAALAALTPSPCPATQEDAERSGAGDCDP